METGDKGVYAVIVIFALLALAGFYFMFEKISDLRNDIKNLELALELYKRGDAAPAPAAAVATNPENQIPDSNMKTPVAELPAEGGVLIPTAIIFQAKSSPLLQPQTDLALTVESVRKLGDGTVLVAIKVFNSLAENYSAIDPATIFEIIDLGGENQQAHKVEGQFNSIPPKGAVTGKVFFKIPADQNSMILQTGRAEAVKFYEFSFTKKTYKETLIG